MRALAAQLVKFGAVGAAGFCVDAGLTLALTQLAQWSPQRGRVPAFLLAASVTWALNRRYTFRSTSGLRSWMPYALLTSVGAVINVGVYLAWLRFTDHSPSQILLGICFGAAAALGFNFTVSRQVIFSNR